MTENEAVEKIKDLSDRGYPTRREAKEMAISALKEIQQYRAIGTVGECREAVEKQKPKKIVYESDSVFCDGFTHYRMGKCPMCDR